MGAAKPTGKLTAGEARDDAELVAAVAEVVGLSQQQVAERLHTAHGAHQVRNLFQEHWPLTPIQLENLNVKLARDHRLHDEIRRALGTTRHLVARRLNAAHGRTLLRNLFWDNWPEIDEAPGQEQGSSDTVLDGGDLDDEHDTELLEPSGPPPLSAGTLLSARYRLLRELREGGFGTAWLAQDRLTGLELVLKIPKEEDGGAIRNELRQAFRIVHPNICPAFPDRDDDTGRPFLVMPYAGNDLELLIHQYSPGPFPLALAVHVLVCVADALDYLHDHLVLHLDVSPRNILMDEEDFVRLTDFGASSLARLRQTEDGNATRLATSLHSLNMAYAAPEQHEGNARSRSDQYSLFRVFCSLLEGRVQTSPHYEFHPFERLTESQNAIVRRALSQDPEQRFDSCAEPARALANGLGDVPTDVLTGDVRTLCAQFVYRVQTEERRMSSATVRLGGSLRLAHGLERVLQATLRWLAKRHLVDPLAELQQEDPHATSLDRTNTSKIAKTITRMWLNFGETAGERVIVAPIAEDLSLTGKRSAIWRLINARNDVIHGRRPPEAILKYASDAAAVLSQIGQPEGRP